MRLINYLLEGFGFLNIQDFAKSSFGFVYSSGTIIKWDFILALIISAFPMLLGFNHLFFYGFFLLVCFEWYTGIKASFKRKERHESRKFGRMLLKLATYCTLIHILNILMSNMKFPEVSGFEFDPFQWIYWVVVVGIIWQLVVSVCENLKELNVKGAAIILKIINRKFYKQFEIEEDEENTPNAA